MREDLCCMPDETYLWLKNSLLDQMFAIEAIKLDGYYKFKFHDRDGFKNYPLSPIYSEWRVAQSIPFIRSMAISLITNLIIKNKLNPDFIAGVPMGGLWVSYGASELLNLGHLLLREPKTHGISKKIEGRFSAGNKVLLIEDVTTTAESVLSAVQVFRDNGLVVDSVVSIQNYDLGATEALARDGIKLFSAISLADILEFALLAGIGSEKVDEVNRYFDTLRKLF